MPDLYCRMHAATKAGAFGVALLLLALMFDAPSGRSFFEGIAIMLFFYLTAPIGALMIGFVSGAVCFWFSVKLKNKLGYDDSLDVFGVHGVGGLIGTLMVAVVGLKALGGISTLTPQTAPAT